MCQRSGGTEGRLPMMKRFNIIIMLVALSFAVFTVSTASGDIYSWTDENGVRYFTNYAPPKQAKLLMKTPEIPYDEDADRQRQEMDRLEAARQELAEREAFLRQQQQEAEQRIAAANARADTALQEANQILQEAEAASADYGRDSNNAYGYYYPYTGYHYPRKIHYYDYYYYYYGGLYRKKHHYAKPRFTHKRDFSRRHAKRFYKPNYRKPSVGRHSTAFRSRAAHPSRTVLFRGR
jgi:hypothetical protein